MKKIKILLVIMVTSLLMFAGFSIFNALPASANGTPSWVRGTWHNKHYVFKFTYKRIAVKNRYKNTVKHYRVHTYVDTPGVDYIYTAKGVDHGFAIQGVNDKLYIARFNYATSIGHWSALKR
ncbi:MAG: hypothetical protein LKF37_10075 [Lentilactobacillus diolivorans]|nr:hypothetical protein [Lentilactobacillus diolivorans]